MENCLDRAFSYAGLTVNAFVGMDVDHCFIFVETFYRANDNAIRVLAVMTGMADNMGHCVSLCDFSGWIDEY